MTDDREYVNFRIPNPESGQLGKYDDVCARALVETGAQMVILIVVDGTKGPGCSVSTVDHRLLKDAPRIVEKLGRDMRRRPSGRP